MTNIFRASMTALLLMLAVSSNAFALDVTGTVDRNALNPDDTLTFTVTISSAEDLEASQPNLPPLNDFEVLNQWSGQETQASLVTGPNGPEFKTMHSYRFNYMLQPKREGSLTIGSTEVVIEGRTFNTKPITIRVGKGLGSQAPPNRRQNPNIQMPPGFEEDEEGDDLFSQLLRRHLPPTQRGGGAVGSRTLPINPNEAFFVQVDTDKTEAYVGEQVTVSFYLYTRGQIRDLDTLKYPSLRGFWKEDIEIATHLNFQQEVVNGLPYRKALLASFALFPIKEGQAVIDSYTAKCTVLGMDSMGGLGFGRPYMFTKSSTPLKITVKPLPTEGRPQDFSGAVGDFQVSARVEDNSVVSHQPFTYKIRFEGKGNAKLIELPPFNPPEGMELYDTQKDAKFFRTGTSYQDFSLLLIPRREGEFTMPALTVSVFDPQLKRYVQKTTDPIRVIVGQGQAPVGGGQGLTLDEAKAKNSNSPPAVLTEFKKARVISAAQQNVISLGLFLLIALGLLFKARTELGWGQRKKDLARRLKVRLARVNSKVDQGDWRGVGVEMTNTVYFVLGEISGEGGANVELGKLLRKSPPSVRREIGESLERQMEVFQVLSFAPEAVVGDLKEPKVLKKHVSEMTKLMEKAVSLGLSSERSGESESNPTTS